MRIWAIFQYPSLTFRHPNLTIATDIYDSIREFIMWLENLKELKKKANKKTHDIVDGTGLPERTVARIFNGETENPSITTLIPIVNFLGGSLDEVFADTQALVSDHSHAALHAKVERMTAEQDLLLAENRILKDTTTAQMAEIELLKTKLMLQEEIIALYKIIENTGK